jgi:hypothetical protein
VFQNFDEFLNRLVGNPQSVAYDGLIVLRFIWHFDYDLS